MITWSALQPSSWVRRQVLAANAYSSSGCATTISNRPALGRTGSASASAGAASAYRNSFRVRPPSTCMAGLQDVSAGVFDYLQGDLTHGDAALATGAPQMQ